MRITYSIYTGCNYNTVTYVVCFGVGGAPSGIQQYTESEIVEEALYRTDEQPANPLSYSDTLQIESSSMRPQFTHKVFNDINAGVLDIQLDQFDQDEFAINVYRIDGQLMFTEPKIKDSMTLLDCSKWSNGIYVVQIQSSTGRYNETKKVALLRE